MKKRPLILITNDDGITAPGIRTLISVMNEIVMLLLSLPIVHKVEWVML